MQSMRHNVTHVFVQADLFMCLIAFALDAHPRWKLLLLGNRDEFHARPTTSLAGRGGEREKQRA